jgi:hypothetical protein
MPAEPRHLPEQESSIKAREHELYVKPLPADGGQVCRPFPEYLRETPAEPLSATTKAILWIVAVLVVLVFLAAIWRITHRRNTRARDRSVPPAAESVALAGQSSVPLELTAGFAVIRYKWTP